MFRFIASTRRALFGLLVPAVLAAAAPAHAGARIVIINTNDPGVGFNDATPAAPVGGNPGTTLGQQRLIAFQHAADLWGAMLDSNVEIRVDAQFAPLGPNILGAAGTTFILRDFQPETAPGFPGPAFPGTWYHSALADKRAGVDLIELEGFPGLPDIIATFSSDFPFYLGIDNNHGTQFDLVTVVLHELGHGLGFSNFVNETTGANASGFTDIYSQFTHDNVMGANWPAFSQAQRAASALRTDKIVWDGRAVTAAVPFVLDFGRPELNVIAPASIAGDFRIGAAAFGAPVSASGVSGNVMVGQDGAGASSTDACEPLTNAVAGRIVLVDRGTCTFVVKVKNAQNAGAIAVLVANNVTADPPPGLAGVDPTITIPAAMISLALGSAIKAQLVGGTAVQASLRVDVSQRAGADSSGFAQLYATNPVQPGSSISHYDSIAFKNQLMEPSINFDLTHELIPPYDLTLPLLRDVGWFVDGNLDGVEDGTFTFGKCTSNAPNVMLPNGATLNDQARVWYRDCAKNARNHGKFVSCVAHVTNEARKDGLITGSEKGAVQSCAAQAK